MHSEGGRSHWDQLGQHAQEILNVQTEAASRGGPMATLTSRVGQVLAHPAFFLTMLFAHVIWVVLNLPFLPWEPWDPYPFTFLATIASVEAPFIALLVLMYQRRMQRIADVREEFSLQILLYVERKTSLTLRMLDEVEDRLDLHEREDSFEALKEDLDPKRVLEDVEQDLEESGED